MLSIPLSLFRHPEASVCANPGFCNHATTLVVLSDRFRSQPPTLRENCQSASRGWVQLLRLRASLRRDGDGLCENSINECSKSSECRDSIPTKGGCDWWREYAIEVDFGLKIGCRLRFIRVHDFRRKSRIDGLCLVLPLSVFRTKEEIL